MSSVLVTSCDTVEAQLAEFMVLDTRPIAIQDYWLPVKDLARTAR